MLKILIIDDEENVRRTFKLRLKKWGFEVFTAPDGPTGLKLLSEVEFHVVIVDLKMPEMPGQEVIERIIFDYPQIEILVITGFATVETAVEIMKRSVCDFLCKPINFSQVQTILEKISERFSLKEENISLKKNISRLKEEVRQRYRFDHLIGKSRGMQDLFSIIENVAPTDSNVLIYGETGTGKEMVAKAIHYNSQRKAAPMIVVDCGAISETLLESELFGHKKGAFTGAQADRRGRFELAHGGTIFLDEIANASADVQKRLLRAIEEKAVQRVGDENTIEVDVRIIAACNEDLMEMVKQGSFRRDLYYRLNVFPIHLPPLRERREDIPLLARYFLDKYVGLLDRNAIDLHPDALRQLTSYDWPGNIRELSNVIERTIIMTPSTMIRHFYFMENSSPATTFDLIAPSLDPPLKDQIEQLERNYIRLALERYHGKINEVANRSGMNSRSLYRKMRRYSLDKQTFR